MKHSYTISGMHCESCVAKVSEALRRVPGVTNVSVTLSPPEARVEMGAHVPTDVLNEAVKGAGSYRLSEESSPAAFIGTKEEPQTLRPLYVIVGYILGGVVLRALISNDFSAHILMTTFMGGFFVVFSLFKMIDLSGFAEGYSTYDLLAKRSREYALAYPFIELLLGVMYLSDIWTTAANYVTLILMSFGSIGVFRALRKKRAIECACLGTALKLPMTKVTLIEDVGMAAMALFMLLML